MHVACNPTCPRQLVRDPYPQGHIVQVRSVGPPLQPRGRSRDGERSDGSSSRVAEEKCSDGSSSRVAHSVDMIAAWHTMRDHATLHPLTSYATPPYQLRYTPLPATLHPLTRTRGGSATTRRSPRDAPPLEPGTYHPLILGPTTPLYWDLPPPYTGIYHPLIPGPTTPLYRDLPPPYTGIPV